VTCLHTNSPGHILTTLYYEELPILGVCLTPPTTAQVIYIHKHSVLLLLCENFLTHFVILGGQEDLLLKEMGIMLP
jgi:hypothetical protein